MHLKTILLVASSGEQAIVTSLRIIVLRSDAHQTSRRQAHLSAKMRSSHTRELPVGYGKCVEPSGGPGKKKGGGDQCLWKCGGGKRVSAMNFMKQRQEQKQVVESKHPKERAEPWRPMRMKTKACLHTEQINFARWANRRRNLVSNIFGAL